MQSVCSIHSFDNDIGRFYRLIFHGKIPEMNFRGEECFILTGDIGFVTQDQLVAIEPVDDGVDGPHGRVN